MAAIGSLTVKLGLVTVEWDKATAKAKAQAKDLQKSFDDLGSELKTLYGHFKTLGGSVSVAAIGLSSLMQTTLAFGNEINDLAQGFDLTISKVLQFRDAIQTSGGKAENAARMITNLFSKIEESKISTATFSAFEKIGFTLEELTSLQPNDVLPKFFEKLQNSVLTTTQKVAILKEMFGRGAAGLSIEGVAEKLSKDSAAYDKNAESIKRFGEISDNLKTTMDNLKLAFADMTLPFLDFFGVTGLKTVDKFKQAMAAIVTGVVVANFVTLTSVVIKLVVALREGAAVMAAMSVLSGNLKGIATVAAAGLAYYGTGKYLESQGAQSGQGTNTVTGTIRRGNVTSDTKTLQDSVVIMQMRNDLAQKMLGYLDRESRIKLDALYTDKAASDIAQAKLKLEEDLAKISAERTAALKKDKITSDEIIEINRKFAIEEATAKKNSYNQIKLIEATRKKEIEDTYTRIRIAKEMFEFEREGFRNQMTSLQLERSSVDLLENERKRKEDIAKIESDRAEQLKKRGLTSEQIAAIDAEASQKVQQANERAAAHAVFIEKSRDKAIVQINAEIAAYRTLADFDLSRVDLEKQRYYMTNQEYRLAQEMLSSNQKVFEMQQKIADLRRQGAGPETDARIKQIEIEIDAEKRLSDARTNAINEDERRRTSFSEGWSEAYRRYQEESINYSKMGADSFNVVVNSMDQALTDFVKNGTIQWKSLVGNIIQGLITIQLRMQAMQLFQSAKMAFFGSPTGTEAAFMDSTIGGFADGGRPPVGVPSIVGENGPEMFIPDRSGTIVPNNQLSSALGGSQVVYNGPYIAQMNAIDTQSATQFLSKNKQAVWAANQSASRGVPASRA